MRQSKWAYECNLYKRFKAGDIPDWEYNRLLAVRNPILLRRLSKAILAIFLQAS